MFLLTSIIIAIISIISIAFTSLAANIGYLGRKNRSYKWMQWAMTHEDEWLANTDRIVKEYGMLRYYGPLQRNRSGTRSKGDLVKYGYDKIKCQYGLICGGELVLGYENYSIQACSDRLPTVNGKRIVLYNPKLLVDGVHRIGYKVVNEGIYYIKWCGEFKEINYKKGYWSTY